MSSRRSRSGGMCSAITLRRWYKILAEVALAHQAEQIDVGGRQDAHVDLDRFRAAQAHEFALLNHAQQLDLRFRADGGDFVEEDGALVGDLEESFLGGHGAGEGALDVAEELRLEQVHGNRAAIDGNEGFSARVEAE